MDQQVLRDQVVTLLRGGEAHMEVESTLVQFPLILAGAKIPEVGHTPWRLVEHMRITQWDILQFCREPDHVSPPHPDGYWPDGDAPDDTEDWHDSITAFSADHQAMQKLVTDPSTDLLAPIPHGDGQTYLREALLVADHNAYHLGQLMMILRVCGG